MTRMDTDRRITVQVYGRTLESLSNDRALYVADGRLMLRFERIDDGRCWQVVEAHGRGRTYEEITQPGRWLTLTDAVGANLPLMPFPSSMPAEKVGFAINGHKYAYVVRDRLPDGSLTTSSWDAAHCDDCPCYSADGDFEPELDW